jgi:hypothetical protein
MQSTQAQKHPYPVVMAISAAGIFILAIIVTAVGRERRGVVFGEPDPSTGFPVAPSGS